LANSPLSLHFKRKKGKIKTGVVKKDDNGGDGDFSGPC
jgi:hypothetical protein